MEYRARYWYRRDKGVALGSFWGPPLPSTMATRDALGKQLPTGKPSFCDSQASSAICVETSVSGQYHALALGKNFVERGNDANSLGIGLNRRQWLQEMCESALFCHDCCYLRVFMVCSTLGHGCLGAGHVHWLVNYRCCNTSSSGTASGSKWSLPQCAPKAQSDSDPSKVSLNHGPLIPLPWNLSLACSRVTVAAWIRGKILLAASHFWALALPNTFGMKPRAEHLIHVTTPYMQPNNPLLRIPYSPIESLCKEG